MDACLWRSTPLPRHPRRAVVRVGVEWLRTTRHRKLHQSILPSTCSRRALHMDACLWRVAPLPRHPRWATLRVGAKFLRRTRSRSHRQSATHPPARSRRALHMDACFRRSTPLPRHPRWGTSRVGTSRQRAPRHWAHHRPILPPTRHSPLTTSNTKTQRPILKVAKSPFS